MTAPFIVTRSTKSVGIAILLTFLFGPLGLFYASVTGGLIMTFTPILLLILTLVGFFQENILLLGWSFALLMTFAATFWLINIIWAIIGVTSYNKEIEAEANRQFELWNRQQYQSPSQFVVNIKPQTVDKSSLELGKMEVTAKPSLHEWLRNNPGKSINDYFSRYRQ